MDPPTDHKNFAYLGGGGVPDLHHTQCCLWQCSRHPECTARRSPRSSSKEYLPGVMVLPAPTGY
jgi:hypothetical protein